MYVDELNQVRDNNGNILYANGVITTTGGTGTVDTTGGWNNGTHSVGSSGMTWGVDGNLVNNNDGSFAYGQDDNMTNILQSLLIIGKMLKYFKKNIQDDTMLKMIKEYEDFTDPYAIDEETIEEIEDLYKL
jgi:hypothetical protein